MGRPSRCGSRRHLRGGRAAVALRECIRRLHDGIVRLVLHFPREGVEAVEHDESEQPHAPPARAKEGCVRRCVWLDGVAICLGRGRVRFGLGLGWGFGYGG